MTVQLKRGEFIPRKYWEKNAGDVNDLRDKLKALGFGIIEIGVDTVTADTPDGPAKVSKNGYVWSEAY